MPHIKNVKLVAESSSPIGLVADNVESIVPSFIATQQVEGDYFILDPNAAKSNDVSVVCAGKESCSAGRRPFCGNLLQRPEGIQRPRPLPRAKEAPESSRSNSWCA